jgi:hypothetical protein
MLSARLIHVDFGAIDKRQLAVAHAGTEFADDGNGHAGGSQCRGAAGSHAAARFSGGSDLVSRASRLLHQKARATSPTQLARRPTCHAAANGDKLQCP